MQMQMLHRRPSQHDNLLCPPGEFRDIKVILTHKHVPQIRYVKTILCRSGIFM